LFRVVNFFKHVVTEVVLFSMVAFNTLPFHEVVLRRTSSVVGSFVTVSLQMLSWFLQWDNF